MKQKKGPARPTSSKRRPKRSSERKKVRQRPILDHYVNRTQFACRLRDDAPPRLCGMVSIRNPSFSGPSPRLRDRDESGSVPDPLQDPAGTPEQVPPGRVVSDPGGTVGDRGDSLAEPGQGRQRGRG